MSMEQVVFQSLCQFVLTEENIIVVFFGTETADVIGLMHKELSRMRHPLGFFFFNFNSTLLKLQYQSSNESVFINFAFNKQRDSVLQANQLVVCVLLSQIVDHTLHSQRIN